jgi:hypothetical protein
VGQRTEHINIIWHFIRGLRNKEEIEADFVRPEDNESDICTKKLPFKLLKGFQENVQNCEMNSRMNWTRIVRIVKVATSKNRHFAQKEHVVN